MSDDPQPTDPAAPPAQPIGRLPVFSLKRHPDLIERYTGEPGCREPFKCEMHDGTVYQLQIVLRGKAGVAAGCEVESRTEELVARHLPDPTGGVQELLTDERGMPIPVAPLLLQQIARLMFMQEPHSERLPDGSERQIEPYTVKEWAIIADRLPDLFSIVSQASWALWVAAQLRAKKVFGATMMGASEQPSQKD